MVNTRNLQRCPWILRGQSYIICQKSVPKSRTLYCVINRVTTNIMNFWARCGGTCQPGHHSEFQDCQSYTHSETTLRRQKIKLAENEFSLCLCPSYQFIKDLGNLRQTVKREVRKWEKHSKTQLLPSQSTSGMRELWGTPPCQHSVDKTILSYLDGKKQHSRWTWHFGVAMVKEVPVLKRVCGMNRW